MLQYFCSVSNSAHWKTDLVASSVSEKTQSMYRSGVGTLLYLTKHSRPDITNPVRELSKSMDGASMAQVTEMYRVINFVLETKTLGLRMVPIFNDGVWKLEALENGLGGFQHVN